MQEAQQIPRGQIKRRGNDFGCMLASECGRISSPVLDETRDFRGQRGGAICDISHRTNGQEKHLGQMRQEEMMKTVLIKGKRPSKFDVLLLTALELQKSNLTAVWNESVRIGIRNEQGDIYRAIGITGTRRLNDAISQMCGLGYLDAVAIDYEAEQGFDMTVSIDCRETAIPTAPGEPGPSGW
jgi:hypothetical protein